VLILAEDNVLVPEPAELVIGGLAFLVVLAAIMWKLAPRIKQLLDERAETIEGGIARAEEMQEQAQTTLAEYREQLASARHEAARLREEARAQGAEIIAEMREQAQAEARRITAQAHQQIDAERQQALTSLRTEVGRLSVELAGRVVGESLEDEARQRRTVDRFLAELESAAENADRADSASGAGQPVVAAGTTGPAT
jgi:F-type H+-transporting ATPase subunit b